MRKVRQSLLAVKDISFRVDPGEFLVVLRPSGCGKGSLLNTVAGTLAPVARPILVADQPVAGPGFLVGMVFPAPALFPAYGAG
jgi:NitT/TauT family transport system ATP-binding protein